MRRFLVFFVAACGGSSGPYFEHQMFFDHDVSGSPTAPTSQATISELAAAGGWGNNDRFWVDFSFDVLHADANTPRMMFTPTDDWFAPDCDRDTVPVPNQGNVEGESGYSCTGGGDCHLLVYDKDAGKLYEMWRADISGAFRGGCLAVWDTTKDYDDRLRGDQCTSADAAGFPIAPMLFTADEVAAGHIDHAIRFVLPNERVRQGFVRPATHATATTGIAGAPYYGVHLRLRSNFPIDSLPSSGAKVVARALQTYGMYHADGGEVALTAATDRYTTAKWDGLLGERDLESLEVEDFEVVDHGSMITLTNQCQR